MTISRKLLMQLAATFTLVIGCVVIYSIYQRHRVRERMSCRSEREDLIKMELVYKKYGPNQQYETNLGNINNDKIWFIHMSPDEFNHYPDYSVKEGSQGTVEIHCSLCADLVASSPGQGPDGTEFNKGVAAPRWSIAR